MFGFGKKKKEIKNAKPTPKKTGAKTPARKPAVKKTADKKTAMRQNTAAKPQKRIMARKTAPAKKTILTVTKARKIPWGRTLSTHDNFIGQSNTGSRKKRGVVVVDTNGENLAVVPLSGHDGKNRTKLKGYGKKTTTYYKHFIETKDDENKPIRVNQKFKENHPNMDVPEEKVQEIRNVVLTRARTKQRNQKVLKEFHNENSAKKRSRLTTRSNADTVNKLTSAGVYKPKANKPKIIITRPRTKVNTKKRK